MAGTTIVSGLSSQPAATGRPEQGHLCYAANQGAWWVFYLTSTQSLSALYSSDFSSWVAPTNSPYSLVKAHRSEGRNFAFGYANIASKDVLHVQANYFNGTSSTWVYNSRFTIGTTWTNTVAETQLNTTTGLTGDTGYFGGGVSLDSSNKPLFTSGQSGNYDGDIASNADAGTSWTTGFAYTSDILNCPNWPNRNLVIPLASGAHIAIADNSSGTNACTNYSYATTWTTSANTSTTVASSNVTSTDPHNAAFVKVSNTDVHAIILSNNSNTFLHRRFNGTSWSNGNTIPNLTFAGPGMTAASDGTNVWLFAFDSSKNLNVIQWTAATPAWGTWSTVLAATNTPSYITCCPTLSSGNIGIMWTEYTGSTYNIIGTLYSTSTTSAGSGALNLVVLSLAGVGSTQDVGSGSITLIGLTESAAGLFATAGTGALALLGLTESASGTFAAPGSGSIAMVGLTESSTGTFAAPGTGSITLSGLVESDAGTFISPGSGSIALSVLTESSSGSFATAGTGAVALSGLTEEDMGTFTTPGSGTVTLSNLYESDAAVFTTTGSGMVVIAGFEVFELGSPVEGTGEITLDGFQASGFGSFTSIGSGEISLSTLLALGFEETPGTTGSGAVTLSGLQTVGSALFLVTGTGAFALGTWSISMPGEFQAVGSGAIILADLFTFGGSPVVGSGAIVLAPFRVDASGDFFPSFPPPTPPSGSSASSFGETWDEFGEPSIVIGESLDSFS